jgi:hypothetical protein
MPAARDYSPDLRLRRDDDDRLPKGVKIKSGVCILDFLCGSSEEWFEWENFALAWTTNAVDDAVINPITTIKDFMHEGLPRPTLTSPYFMWCREEHYDVYEETSTSPGAVVGSFNVVVPLRHDVLIRVHSVVTFSKEATPSQREIMRKAFKDFDGSDEQRKIIETRLTAEGILADDLYEDGFTFSLTRYGDLQEDVSQREAKVAMYEGRANGVIFHGPEKGDSVRKSALSEYTTSRRRAHHLLPDTYLTELPPTTADTGHRNVIHGGGDIEGAIEKLAIDEVAQQDKCAGGDYEVEKYPIADLFEYPEFKIVWKTCTIRIGRWLRISFPYPMLQKRISVLSLWAFVRRPIWNDASDNFLVSVIERCVFIAALSGTIVGAVTGNLPAAIETFRTVFTVKLKEVAREAISCLLPSLALVSGLKRDWEDA